MPRQYNDAETMVMARFPVGCTIINKVYQTKMRIVEWAMVKPVMALQEELYARDERGYLTVYTFIRNEWELYIPSYDERFDQMEQTLAGVEDPHENQYS